MLKKIKLWLSNRAEKLRIERENKRILDQLERNRQYWNLIRHVERDAESSEAIVDYMDTRMIGQRPVTPNIVRPFGLRRDKF